VEGERARDELGREDGRKKGRMELQTKKTGKEIRNGTE
jgi:hypothetical protein